MKQEGKNGGTLHSWDRGQSGNPKGRPKNLTATLLEELKTADDVEFTIITHKGSQSAIYCRLSVDGPACLYALVASQLLFKACLGDLKAIKAIFDLTEGKAGPLTVPNVKHRYVTRTEKEM